MIMCDVVKCERFAHGALDTEGTHVLPVLQQEYQEADSLLDVAQAGCKREEGTYILFCALGRA